MTNSDKPLKIAFFSAVAFKCIICLLAIAAVAGGLLSVLHFLLYVSPEEKTARAIRKLYGEEKTYEVVTEEPFNVGEMGTNNKIYIVGDKTSSSYDMLFNSTGNEGYKYGTITVWVKVTVENGTYSITQVLLESFDKQTLMSKLGDDYYNGFLLADITEKCMDGTLFAPHVEKGKIPNVVTGATKSANAGCNAVNCVIKYVIGEASI